MIRLTAKQTKKIRGIIVWDFDRVLFDTDRFYRGAKQIFQKYGVSPESLWKMVLKIRKEGSPFSTARALRILRGWKFVAPEKEIRRELHNHLAETPYFGLATDLILHGLRKRGFLHMILSYGAASYLHKRVRIGCGEKFTRHFIKILATRRPKHFFFKKLVRLYPHIPIFFVDDTRDNVELIKKYVPSVITIHYAKNWSLKKVERTIFKYVRESKY